MPEPWPRDGPRRLRSPCSAPGAAAIPVLESLDQAGLLGRLIPEWDAVRCRAQHNPVHRFTVDRHLLETAAHAAEHTREVDRPDLLLVGALLHDIGKGYPGDHSDVGAEHAAARSRRGWASPTTTSHVIVALVRHHLLLPDTATRRDLRRPEHDQDRHRCGRRIGRGARAAARAADRRRGRDRAGGLERLEGRADRRPAARARAVLRGAPRPAPPLDDERRALAEAGELAVVVRDREIVVAAPDGAGASTGPRACSRCTCSTCARRRSARIARWR